MYEDDMLLLIEQKETAEDALKTTITSEQRERLQAIIKAVNAEIKNSYYLTRSLILPKVEL